MRVRNFNLAVVKVDCQTTKFNSPPNFPAIWYISNYWQVINLKFAKLPNLKFSVIQYVDNSFLESEICGTLSNYLRVGLRKN